MLRRGSSILLIVAIASFMSLGMARHGQYDEEAREAERISRDLEKGDRNNPAKSIASGVKDATITSTTELVTETADGTVNDTPVLGTLEGARKGSSNAVKSAAKGVFKVATLGYGDTENMQVQQPAADSDDVTKFKIGF